jgi:hypothetical protein
MKEWTKVYEEQLEKINEEATLREFISKMAENSVDLDPSIVEMVNEHFWELI